MYTDAERRANEGVPRDAKTWSAIFDRHALASAEDAEARPFRSIADLVGGWQSRLMARRARVLTSASSRLANPRERSRGVGANGAAFNNAIKAPHSSRRGDA